MKKTPNRSIIIKNKEGVINIEETLFQNRKLYLNDTVSPDMIDQLIKQILILDSINNDPIHLYISSPGGNVDDGFALIDVMKQCKSKIITYAQGSVASMATLIFISGKERVCYKHSIFMFHDMFAGGADYSAKLKSRMEFFDKEYKVLENHILENTKLTPEDCQAMRNGELWLFAEEAKAKKVTDTIL